MRKIEKIEKRSKNDDNRRLFLISFDILIFFQQF